MRQFKNPEAFAAFLVQQASLYPRARKAAFEEACKVVETAAKKLIGTEYEGWEDLKDSTVAEKERLGYVDVVSATDPLLRTGDLAASISHRSDEQSGQVGSDSDIAVYQEFGTEKGIPPRPFISTAGIQTHEKVADIMAKHVYRLVAGYPVRTATVSSETSP
ncbi:MAG: hypothetical protein ACRYHQ_14630 [Janthinobacterium lividum]